MKPRVPVFLGPSHPLGTVAERQCIAPKRDLIGGVACGMCWERTIRDDERFAVEHCLPRDLVPDPDYVDEIAVDLACRGERVELTAAELQVAVRRLAKRRLFPIEIARRLHVRYGKVSALLDQRESQPVGVAA